MQKKNIKKARKHLTKIKEIISKNPTPIFRMNKEETIRALRKTRKTIWEEKIGSGS